MYIVGEEEIEAVTRVLREGKLFRSFLKVADTCSVCGEELHHQRADDAPPYFTMFIVGHIVVPLADAQSIPSVRHRLLH